MVGKEWPQADTEKGVCNGTREEQASGRVWGGSAVGSEMTLNPMGKQI